MKEGGGERERECVDTLDCVDDTIRAYKIMGLNRQSNDYVCGGSFFPWRIGIVHWSLIRQEVEH